MCQTEFNLMMLWGNSLAEIEGWGQEGADARMVTEELDLATRRENRGNLSRAIS